MEQGALPDALLECKSDFACGPAFWFRFEPLALVSFEMGSFSTRRSFPRKRESSLSTAHCRTFAEWTPAFAG